MPFFVLLLFVPHLLPYCLPLCLVDFFFYSDIFLFPSCFLLLMFCRCFLCGCHGISEHTKIITIYFKLSLVGCRLWGHTESETTEATSAKLSNNFNCIQKLYSFKSLPRLYLHYWRHKLHLSTLCTCHHWFITVVYAFVFQSLFKIEVGVMDQNCKNLGFCICSYVDFKQRTSAVIRFKFLSSILLSQL